MFLKLLCLSHTSRVMYRLYARSRLVHGDLSEYNILVVPAYLVENVSSDLEDVKNERQAVLIDFGQAVDCHHPDAEFYLRRDIERANAFFEKQGVKVVDIEEAITSIFHYADAVKAEMKESESQKEDNDTIANDASNEGCISTIPE
jgi:RIO kinase 1